MPARMGQLRRAADHGFTLVELLVVMIIIAILMAVAIPLYTGQRDKAHVSNTKVAIRHMMTWIEGCAVGNEGAYTLCGPHALKADDGGLFGDITRRGNDLWFCDKGRDTWPGESATYSGNLKQFMPRGANCNAAPAAGANGYPPWSGVPGHTLWQVYLDEYWISMNTPLVRAGGQKSVVTFFIHHDADGDKRGCRVGRDWNINQTTGPVATEVLKAYCPLHASDRAW